MPSYEWGVEGEWEDYTIEADNAQAALKIAIEKARNVDWGWAGDRTPESTIWIQVFVQNKDDDDDEAEETNVAFDPPEPPCAERETHWWQTPWSVVGGNEANPGYWAHDGGAYITEGCLKCGCGKHQDTWAQNPENGVQGLTSVYYTEHEFDQYVVKEEEGEN